MEWNENSLRSIPMGFLSFIKLSRMVYRVTMVCNKRFLSNACTAAQCSGVILKHIISVNVWFVSRLPTQANFLFLCFSVWYVWELENFWFLVSRGKKSSAYVDYIRILRFFLCCMCQVSFFLIHVLSMWRLIFVLFVLSLSFLNTWQSNALLTRRILNGELEPSKILGMSPNELKVSSLSYVLLGIGFLSCFLGMIGL